MHMGENTDIKYKFAQAAENHRLLNVHSQCRNVKETKLVIQQLC